MTLALPPIAVLPPLREPIDNLTKATLVRGLQNYAAAAAIGPKADVELNMTIVEVIKQQKAYTESNQSVITYSHVV